MTYLEKKVDLIVAAARAWCGQEAMPFEVRHEIAVDALELCGRIFSKRDPVLLKKMAELLSIFPLLKKDAEGLFRESLVSMEDVCLSIQVKLQELERS